MEHPGNQGNAIREFELARELHSVGVLNEALDAWLHGCAVPESVRRAAQVCCDEIVANVVLHAGEVPDPIRVSMQVDDKLLRASFIYRARKFDPKRRGAPDTNTPVSQRNAGGLGLHIVQSLTQCFEFHEEDGHHHLHIELAFPR